MLRIRLQRLGRKKQPSYRLVVSERTKDTQGNALEIVGHYNPIAQPKVIEFNAERIKHWVEKGAQPSNTVFNLLVAQGILEGKKKMKSVTLTNKRKAKIEDKKKQEIEKKEAEAAKAAEAAEAAKAAKAAEEEAAKAKKAEEEAAAQAPAEAEKTEESPAEVATEEPAAE